jgi:hypothetical protein
LNNDVAGGATPTVSSPGSVVGGGLSVANVMVSAGDSLSDRMTIRFT